MPNPLVVLIAAVGGVAIALQSLFSGTIGRHLGVLGAVFLVHLEGLVLAGLLLLLRGGGLAGWRDIPWYALLAGFIGVAIVACVSYAVPRLGLAATLTVTIAAQLLLGAALDHFGLLGAALRPLDPTRILGIAALLLGSWLVLR
jgi:transporter family-2 protein